MPEDQDRQKDSLPLAKRKFFAVVIFFCKISKTVVRRENVMLPMLWFRLNRREEIGVYREQMNTKKKEPHEIGNYLFSAGKK
jgi:hypothetical protein